MQARVGRHRRDLAGVVGLDAADRHERVAALGERVGDEVLELADLVAAEREAAVAVLALGPHRGAAQVLRQAVEPLDRRRTEQQRGPGEVGERHWQAPVIVAGRTATQTSDDYVESVFRRNVPGTRQIPWPWRASV